MTTALRNMNSKSDVRTHEPYADLLHPIEAAVLAAETDDATQDRCRKLVDERQQMERALRGYAAELQMANEFNERQGAQLRVLVEQLEVERERAETAMQAKSAFLANMSHEIRTPMTAVLGYADMLLEECRDPMQIEWLEIIRRNGSHLLELLDDILDLSKIEAGRMTAEPVPCAPQEIVADVVALFAERAAGKGLVLSQQWVGAIPAVVQTDPTRLRQILINLVGNAVKFTERGGVTVTIRARSQTSCEPAPHIVVDVADTGPGISSDNQRKLFQAFTQVDGSLTRKFGGTGLGLAISRRLAELLGGELSVCSTLGAGSTFSLAIPATI